MDGFFSSLLVGDNDFGDVCDLEKGIEEPFQAVLFGVHGLRCPHA